MAELAPNYNIQCMKLFQELKSAFPCIPDMVVRQCMKQVWDIWSFNANLSFCQTSLYEYEYLATAEIHKSVLSLDMIPDIRPSCSLPTVVHR